MRFPDWVPADDLLMHELIRVRMRGLTRLTPGTPDLEFLPALAAAAGLHGDPAHTVESFVRRALAGVSDPRTRGAAELLLGASKTAKYLSSQERRRRLATEYCNGMSLTAVRAPNGPERRLLEFVACVLDDKRPAALLTWDGTATGASALAPRSVVDVMSEAHDAVHVAPGARSPIGSRNVITYNAAYRLRIQRAYKATVEKTRREQSGTALPAPALSPEHAGGLDSSKLKTVG